MQSELKSPINYLEDNSIQHQYVASEDFERAFFLYYSAKEFERSNIGPKSLAIAVGCAILGVWLAVPFHAAQLGLILGSLVGVYVFKVALESTLTKLKRKYDYERWMDKLVQQYKDANLISDFEELDDYDD